jgi:hypothetical protein
VVAIGKRRTIPDPSSPAETTSSSASMSAHSSLVACQEHPRGVDYDPFV